MFLHEASVIVNSALEY